MVAVNTYCGAAATLRCGDGAFGEPFRTRYTAGMGRLKRRSPGGPERWVGCCRSGRLGARSDSGDGLGIDEHHVVDVVQVAEIEADACAFGRHPFQKLERAYDCEAIRFIQLEVVLNRGGHRPVRATWMP